MSNGDDSSYKKLLLEDYEEIPVTIEEFLHEPKYLGRGLTDDTGRFTVYPYWEETLKKLFPDPLKPVAYNTLALTGGIGLGKSFMASLVMCYELYRMLCLKDPYVHYNLQPIDKISFAVMNITLDAARGVGWDKLQQLLQSSEWFLRHGKVTGTSNLEWHPDKRIELICGSQNRHILGRAVYACFFDEVSFQPNQDVAKQIEKAKSLVNTASARMQSRFMRGEKNPTILVLASSKRTEQSYMETFIQARKARDSKTTYIVDEPQWVIRNDKVTDKWFKVAVGNKFLASEVLPLNITDEEVIEVRNRGFNIIDVPMGYYENFLEDIDVALTDIAGISTTSSSRYISGVRLSEIKTKDYVNPFTKEVLEIGNSPEDEHQYYDYFDLTKIPEDLKSKPLFIHMDMSISGDKTGIAGVWIIGKKPPQPNQPESKDLIYQAAFAVAIKAPKGFQVSFEKNRNFIRWLREQGFSVKVISTDTFQSYDTGQALLNEGFKHEMISVDRTNSDRVCVPYQYFKSAIYEKRLILFEHELLTEEIIGLERDNNSGRVDHSPSGINCFSGDTKVSLLDGRELSFEELMAESQAGKHNYVYSINPATKRVEPKLIKKVWCSGVSEKIALVTLDSGEVIKCTPEHRFMLRDGTYCEAQYLQPEQSLMPLYRKLNEKGLVGYRLYYEPIDEGWHFEHRQFAKEVYDERYLVHHKNCNKLDNSPTNLVWVSKGEHVRIHAQIQSGAYSPEATKHRSDSTKNYHKTHRDQPEYWLRFYPDSKNATEALNRHLCYEATNFLKAAKKAIYQYIRDVNYGGLTKSQFLREQQLSKQNAMALFFNVKLEDLTPNELKSYMIRFARMNDPTYTERVSKAVSENHKLGKYKNAYAALSRWNSSDDKKARQQDIIKKGLKTKSERTYVVSEECRRALSIATSNRRWYNNGVESIYINKDEPVPDGFVPGRIKTWKNHKVVSVEIVNIQIPVFDMEVEDNHNFALSAGVFVHNSKDISDALCGALYSASKHAEEFAYDYGELLDHITTTNDTYLDTNKEQLSIDFEEELRNAQLFSSPDDARNLDFGMGGSFDVGAVYAEDGILVW